jgi:hypothetical protein
VLWKVWEQLHYSLTQKPRSIYHHQFSHQFVIKAFILHLIWCFWCFSNNDRKIMFLVAITKIGCSTTKNRFHILIIFYYYLPLLMLFYWYWIEDGGKGKKEMEAFSSVMRLFYIHICSCWENNNGYGFWWMWIESEYTFLVWCEGRPVTVLEWHS